MTVEEMWNIRMLICSFLDTGAIYREYVWNKWYNRTESVHTEIKHRLGEKLTDEIKKVFNGGR